MLPVSTPAVAIGSTNLESEINLNYILTKLMAELDNGVQAILLHVNRMHVRTCMSRCWSKSKSLYVV